MKHNPLVAIRCTVYNHEPYLRNCLEGFVMQKTNFPFVAVVHDDASTDGSADIIREYAKNYPDIIKPIYETENQYSKGIDNFVRIMQMAIDATRAKYVAMCEGDDYWTDPYKLRKQVDFMENHLDYSMCCHSVDWYQGTELIKRNIKADVDIDLHVDDIISQGGFYINLCSILYRANLAHQKSDFQKIATYGDHPLYIKLALQGKVRCLHEVMGRYRYMVNGSWTNRNYLDNHAKALHYYNTICWMFSLNKETNGKYKAAIVSLLGGIFRYTYEYGGFPNNWEYIKMSVFFGRKVLIRACKDVLIQLCPQAYALFRRIIDI